MGQWQPYTHVHTYMHVHTARTRVRCRSEVLACREHTIRLTFAVPSPHVSPDAPCVSLKAEGGPMATVHTCTHKAHMHNSGPGPLEACTPRHHHGETRTPPSPPRVVFLLWLDRAEVTQPTTPHTLCTGQQYEHKATSHALQPCRHQSAGRPVATARAHAGASETRRRATRRRIPESKPPTC